MGTVIDSLELDRATLAPVRRTVGGMGMIKLNYSEMAITGEIGMPGQMQPVNVELAAPVFAGGAGLEMSVAGLPLAEGYETTLRSFDPEGQRVRPMQLTVRGVETAECAAGTFETFVVELVPLDGDEAGTSTIHVMTQAPHHIVLRELRLPAAMGGGMGNKELTSMGSGSSR